MTTVHALQASAWDAECRHDLDTLLGHFAPEAVFHPAGGAPQTGHAAIRAMTEEFYAAYPDLSIEVRREWTDETSGAFEFRAHLVDTQGARSTLDGICLVEVAEGRFTSVRYYEDAPVPV